MADLYQRQLEFVRNYTEDLEKNIEEIRVRKDFVLEKQKSGKANVKHSSLESIRKRICTSSSPVVVDKEGFKKYKAKVHRRKFFYFSEILKQKVKEQIRTKHENKRQISWYTQKIWQRKKLKKSIKEINKKFDDIIKNIYKKKEREITDIPQNNIEIIESFKSSLIRQFADYLFSKTKAEEWVAEIVSKYS